MLRPTANNVKILNKYKILIYFDNGEKKVFDVENLLSRKPYQPLINYNLFKTLKTNGISIECDEDINICPDELYYYRYKM